MHRICVKSLYLISFLTQIADFITKSHIGARFHHLIGNLEQRKHLCYVPMRCTISIIRQPIFLVFYYASNHFNLHKQGMVGYNDADHFTQVFSFFLKVLKWMDYACECDFLLLFIFYFKFFKES